MTNQKFYILKERKKNKKQLRKAIKKKHKKELQRSTRHKQKKYKRQNSIKKIRKYRKRQMLSNYMFNEPSETIYIDDEFGLEESKSFDKYIGLAEKIIDANSEFLKLNIRNCNRFWPSAITLICSLIEWIELAGKKNNIPFPKVGSNIPKNEEVEEYLKYSGFYNYVNRVSGTKTPSTPIKGIVKIQRELNRDLMEERERDLDQLIKKYSSFNSDQFELFSCKVLPEVTNNVIEHGDPAYDQGWWILGQYHKEHGIISINIADNGIGIKESLITGPQKEQIDSLIKKQIKNIPYRQKQDDHLYLKLAFTENISGAYDAKPKEKDLLNSKYEIGAKRGHGLKRILNTCKFCNCTLTVLSHYGYIRFDKYGNEEKIGSTKNRIFAGTLYHIVIPAKEIINE